MAIKDPLASTRSLTRRVLLCTAVLSAGLNVLLVAGPAYVMQVFDRIIAAREADPLQEFTVVVAIALVAIALVDLVRRLVGHRLGAWIERRLVAGVVSAEAHRAGTAGAGSGGTVHGLRDLETLRRFLADGGLWPVIDAPWTPVFLGAVYLLHPTLAAVALAGALLLLGLLSAAAIATRSAVRDAAEIADAGRSDANAAMRNADALVGMGMLPAFLARWTAVYEEGDKTLRRVERRMAVLAATASLVRSAVPIAIVAMAATLAVAGQLTDGAVVAAALLAQQAVAPLSRAVEGWRAIAEARLAYRRATHVVDEMRDPVAVDEHAVAHGHLTLEQVGYAVATVQDPILREISFALPAGECLGIIGPSGAGKTTLLRVITGIVAPDAGTVRIDDVDIRALAPSHKSRLIGFLPQDVELFDGTVRENIARFAAAEDDEIIRAAKLAGAHAVILRLPRGYDTVIGRTGVALSAGQRQRIGLARAVFGEPRLVVLDEPNAHLDTDGEQALVGTLQRLRESHVTVVLVTQRMSLISLLDKVLLMRDGDLEAFGPAPAVMAESLRRASTVRDIPRPKARARGTTARPLAETDPDRFFRPMAAGEEDEHGDPDREASRS